MPRSLAPIGAEHLEDDFEQALDVVHGIYEKCFGYPAERRDDPLLVDFADRLASHRWDEFRVARRLWNQAGCQEGTPPRTRRFHELFYKRLSPEEQKQYREGKFAYQSAMSRLGLHLQGVDLERVVRGVPAGEGRREQKPLGHLVHEDETGQLWEVPLMSSDPLLAEATGVRLVRVVDVRPGSDGTFPVYWWFVPSAAETARVGVAWTFGVNPAHYRPTVEA